MPDDEFTLFLDESDAHLEQFDDQVALIVVHDPQPVALVRKRAESDAKWVWRCHIDHVATPITGLGPPISLRASVRRRDLLRPQFSRDLRLRPFFVSPSIDPLNDKNRDLPESFIDSVLNQHHIPRDEPIITQVSRLDHLKDPIGLMGVFDAVHRSFDCRLVLTGGTADDDPESGIVLEQVMARASGDRDVHILLLPP